MDHPGSERLLHNGSKRMTDQAGRKLSRIVFMFQRRGGGERKKHIKRTKASCNSPINYNVLPSELSAKSSLGSSIKSSTENTYQVYQSINPSHVKSPFESISFPDKSD